MVVINNKLFVFKMQEKIQFLKFKQLQAVRFAPKAIKRYAHNYRNHLISKQRIIWNPSICFESLRELLKTDWWKSSDTILFFYKNGKFKLGNMNYERKFYLFVLIFYCNEGIF